MSHGYYRASQQLPVKRMTLDAGTQLVRHRSCVLEVRTQANEISGIASIIHHMLWQIRMAYPILVVVWTIP